MAAPPVMVFDRAGNFVKGWGGAGSGYEWPEREHGIHIDYKGYVWIGGNNCPARALPGLQPRGDDQLLKFTQDGKFVKQIGHSTQSKGNADTKNFHQPADAVVYAKTNEVFVADGYGNHRVIVMDADTGAFKRMWGAFGNKPMDKDQCPPPSLNSVPDGPGPDQFSIVHAIRVSNDGIVYVADRENRRVQTFTLDGKFIHQLVRGSDPFARDLALSPDPEQQFLYVGGGHGYRGGQSQDHGDRDYHSGRRRDGRRAPDANRFERQSLYCAHQPRAAKADIQRDFEQREVNREWWARQNSNL